MKNILTIDVEEWFHANYPRGAGPLETSYSTVRKNVETLLSILHEHDAKATFFILGSVAEADPKLVTDIQNHGHEIASHGYGHQLVYCQTREEFKADIGRSLGLLRNITNTPVVGYRAPSWSIDRSCSWALEELVEQGVVYDSSIFPMRTFLYGDSRAARSISDLSLPHNRHLTEVPPSTLSILGRRIAFSGGFYFRLLPYQFIKIATLWMNTREKQPAIFYLHPREIDVNQPRLTLSRRDEFIHYVNLRSTEAKLRRFLTDFKVTSVIDHLQSNYLL